MIRYFNSNPLVTELRSTELADDASEPADDDLEAANYGKTLAVDPEELMPTGNN